MAFKRGISGNPAGRPPGTKNRVNDEIRTRINNFLDDNFETVENDIMELEPRDRIKFFIELLQYGLPKLKQTELKNESGHEIKIILPNCDDL
jgi:hypothetical protein